MGINSGLPDSNRWPIDICLNHYSQSLCQLSYNRDWGVLPGIRTQNLVIRSHAPCPLGQQDVEKEGAQHEDFARGPPPHY